MAEVGEIVVGYDGSACGRAALEKALDLARGLDDRVAIVFGYAPPGIWGGEIAEHEEAIEEFGAKVTDEARRMAQAGGVEAEVEMVAGKPHEALVEAARARDARMIVVGSYGDPPLKGMILGSTPNKLLHTSEYPVLVVRADS